MKGLIATCFCPFSAFPRSIQILNLYYTGFNISYIQSQTKKAIEAEKLNIYIILPIKH